MIDIHEAWNEFVVNNELFVNPAQYLTVYDEHRMYFTTLCCAGEKEYGADAEAAWEEWCKQTLTWLDGRKYINVRLFPELTEEHRRFTVYARFNAYLEPTDNSNSQEWLNERIRPDLRST